jgi:hypothetical protein
MEMKRVREIDLLASLYPWCKENIEFMFDKGVNTRTVTQTHKKRRKAM